ncbi:uncharacterized protein LOC129730821 [Wyeomyia smithii]|uniref:uncharacterized protein LOC129730821 n=1 Tax=Wyeomyia smithii TaxID=174621 RepID=UPI00246816CA|nr:uncharacterized protein LOC129730821 [Wyeomyia smithii]
MTVKSIQRHLKKDTIDVVEGVINVKGLKSYLERNGYPLIVALCEDATKITSNVEYNYLTDSLRGLVAPLNSNGLPTPNLFAASSPHVIINAIHKYPVGSYAYVQLALPLAINAAPYVLFHTCSDNRFEAADVLNRWTYTESILNQHGINVISNTSDGDPRLLKAMKIRAGLDNEITTSTFSPWFIVHNKPEVPMNVQDMVHIVNKFRNRFLNKEMQIGKLFKCEQNIENKFSCFIADIDLKDKMKLDPTLKMIKEKLINHLEANVQDSKETVLFLKIMRLMFRSYVDEDLSLLERVHAIWTANFIVRNWRNWCKKHIKILNF